MYFSFLLISHKPVIDFWRTTVLAGCCIKLASHSFTKIFPPTETLFYNCPNFQIMHAKPNDFQLQFLRTLSSLFVVCIELYVVVDSLQFFFVKHVYAKCCIVTIVLSCYTTHTHLIVNTWRECISFLLSQIATLCKRHNIWNQSRKKNSNFIF